MVIDASVWVAAFLQRDPHRPGVMAFLLSLATTPVEAAIPSLCLAEVGGAIARRSSAATAAEQAVQLLRDLPWLYVIDSDTRLATLAVDIAIGQRLRGADAVYAALAAYRRAPLVTLDNEIIERAGGVFQALTPPQWLEITGRSGT